MDIFQIIVPAFTSGLLIGLFVPLLIKWWNRVKVIPPIYRNNLTDTQRESIIESALETDEGRTALAQAMVEPIRRSLDYQSVGRRILAVDELPQGALARYETTTNPRDLTPTQIAIARSTQLWDLEYRNYQDLEYRDDLEYQDLEYRDIDLEIARIMLRDREYRESQEDRPYIQPEPDIIVDGDL